MAIDEKKLIEDFKNTFSDSVLNQTFGFGKYSLLEALEEMINRQSQIVTDTNVGSKWIPCEERLPTKEEYLKDDGRFIVTDGNRTYQSCFDIYSNVFRTIVLRLPFYSYEHDKCVIAWQPLPQTFKKEGAE